MTGIYKITNSINGKMYIGSSSNLKQRESDHFKDSTINDKKHLPLYKDMIKYGKGNFVFEKIEDCTEDELFQREDYFLVKYKTHEKGYNISSKAIAMHDEEIMKQHGERMREWNLEQWKDEEYRIAKSKASSELQKERLKNKEYLAEKSGQLKQYTDSIKRTVGQYDKQGNLIATFDGLREAERALNLPNDSVGKVCRGVNYRKTAGGYVWKYL